MLFIAFFGGIGTLFVTGTMENSRVTDIAEQYIEHVRSDRHEQAYALLAPAVQGQIPPESFPAWGHTPDLAGAGQYSHLETNTYSATGSCIKGGIQLANGEGRIVRVFVKEDRVWELFLTRSGVKENREGPWHCY